MSRVINTHTYATQSITGESAVYGAIISGAQITAKFSSLATKQGGVPGVRVSRAFQKNVTGADGVVRPVSVTYTVFYPTGVDTSEVSTPAAELTALMGESGFVTAMANKSLE
jgi:hypothetical protein